MSGQLCDRCALIYAPEARAYYPSDGRDELTHATDGLCEVMLAISGVEYNARQELDLATLMAAGGTIHKMTLQYRGDQPRAES